MPNVSGVEVEVVHICDAPRAVDDSIRFDVKLGSLQHEDDLKAPAAGLDVLDSDSRFHVDADALACGANLGDGVGIHRREQLGQGLENGYFCAGAGIDVSKLERNDAASDKDHFARQLPLV